MHPRSFIYSNHTFEGSSPTQTGHIACGPSTTVTSFSKCFADGSILSLICIGYLISLENIKKTNIQVLEDLALSYYNEQDFHNQLSYINGRYALIINYNGEFRVYHDATAIRTVFYTSGEKFFLSSHSHLVAQINRSTRANEYFKHYQFGYPGLMSQFDGVQILPANFYLDPMTGAITRYWPSEARVERTLEDACDVFSHYVLKARDGILCRQKPIASLTGGMDTRTTFAAFRDCEKVEYFTYFQSHEKSDSDIAMAQKICAAYGRIHKTIVIKRKIADDKILSIPGYTHIPHLTECYLDHFGSKDLIHVRSNITTIGKNYWKRLFSNARGPYTGGPSRPYDFIRRHNKWKPWSDAEEFADIQFRQMFSRIGYDPLSAPMFHGYDSLDLFYWEHCLTTWHGPLLLGSDFAFDTFILFNSRAALEAMLCVSEADRRNWSVQKLFVQRYAEKIALFPINPPAPMGVHRILSGIRWRIAAARYAVARK